MFEPNVPQAQAGESGIQQQPYGLGGGQSGYNAAGGQPYQAFQQPLIQEWALQQNPSQQTLAQQSPVQQNPGQQSQQSPIQQTPPQQSPVQQNPGQQNPTQQSQQSPVQQSPGQQQTPAPQQSPGQQTPTQQSQQSPVQQTPTQQNLQQNPAQSPQSQQLRGAGQPQFANPTAAGPYGEQSAVARSSGMATQGPSIQTPSSELSATDTAGTQVQTVSSPVEPQSAEPQQPPVGRSAYEQEIAQELRAAVGSLDQLANVAEWAETRFAQQGNVDASRACEDVHDRAHTTTDFILRGSPFAASAARELQATIGGAMQELQQYQTPEAQEMLTQAQQANQLLDAAIARLNPAGGGPQ